MSNTDSINHAKKLAPLEYILNAWMTLYVEEILPECPEKLEKFHRLHEDAKERKIMQTYFDDETLEKYSPQNAKKSQFI